MWCYINNIKSSSIMSSLLAKKNGRYRRQVHIFGHFEDANTYYNVVTNICDLNVQNKGIRSCFLAPYQNKRLSNATWRQYRRRLPVFNSVKKQLTDFLRLWWKKPFVFPWSSILAVAINGENISRYVNLQTNPRQQRNGIILLQFVSV